MVGAATYGVVVGDMLMVVDDSNIVGLGGVVFGTLFIGARAVRSAFRRILCAWRTRPRGCSHGRKMHKIRGF